MAIVPAPVKPASSLVIVTFLLELPVDLGVREGLTIDVPEKPEMVEASVFRSPHEVPAGTQVDTRFVFRRAGPHQSRSQTIAVEVFDDFWEGLEFVDSEPAREQSRAALPATVVAATTATVTGLDGAISEPHLTRTFDKTLRQLNQFLTMLGFCRRNPDVGAVRRTELPPYIPVVLDAVLAEPRHLELSTLQLHRFDQSLPADDSTVEMAWDLAFRDRKADWPFGPAVALLQRARRDRYANDHEQSVIALVTATELLAEVVVGEALRVAGQSDRVAGVLQTGFANLMRDHLAPLIERLRGDSSLVDQWLDGCYRLRKLVAHEGYVPSHDEMEAAMGATVRLAGEIGHALRADPVLSALGDQLPIGRVADDRETDA